MLKFFKKTYHYVKNAFLNYPLSIISLLVLFFFLEQSIFKQITDTVQITLSLILLILLSLSVYTYKFKNSFYENLGLFASILIPILFYYFLPSNLKNLYSVQIYYIYVTFIVAFSILFLAGYTKDDKSYYEYVIYLFTKILKTILISLIVFFTFMIFLLIIDKLFIKISSNLSEIIIKSITYFSFVLFAGFYFIGRLNEKEEEIKYEKSTNFLLNYVLIPAIFIYFILLTIYEIKALFQLPHWPKGIVTYLIIGFSIIGYMIYILIYKLNFGEKFKKYFPILVLIQIPILIIAAYLRIQQYGLTFNRYLLVLFIIILAILSIYYTFSKRKNLAFIFISIIAILLLSSFGPWSINNLPKISQEKKLINILKENNLINGNKINLEKIKNSDNKIKSIIANKLNYLCNYHGCENIEILKPIIKQIKKENPNISKWKLENNLFEKLGLNDIYYIPEPLIEEKEDKISKYIHSEDKNIYIFGYTYVIPIQKEKNKNLYNDGYFITVDENNIYLYEDKKLVGKKELAQDKLNELFENNKKGEFEFNIGDYKIKLILLDYQLIKDKNKIKLGYVVEAYGLLKRK